MGRGAGNPIKSSTLAEQLLCEKEKEKRVKLEEIIWRAVIIYAARG